MTQPGMAEVPVRRRRWLPWAAAAAVPLVLAGYAAWWLLWSSPLEGGDGFGVSMGDIEPGEVRSIEVALLCLDGADRLTVDDVTVDPAGLTVTDFAVRPLREPPALAFGSGGAPLRDTDSPWSRTITASCADGERVELVVDVVRGVTGPAHTEDVDVHWSAGIRSGVRTVPVQITLCASDQVDENCAKDEPPL